MTTSIENLDGWSSSASPDAVFSRNYSTEFSLPAERTRREVSSLATVFDDLPAGSVLLDIGCGEGRTMFPLADRFPDYSVVGLDINPRWDQAKVPCNAAMAVADMRELPLRDNSVDGAFFMFTTFGYFSDRDNLKALSEASRVLKPGGRLIIDSANSERIVNNFVAATDDRDRGDGTIVTYQRELVEVDESVTGLANPKYLFETRKNHLGESLQPMSIRLYDRDDYAVLAKMAGMTDCMFVDSALDSFDPEESRRMWVVMTKQAR